MKATGLGITELFLRYIAWLCLKDDKLKNSQVCIITGPRIELAIVLIDRMKKLFHNLNIYPENKETVLELNGVKIEAFPSHHLDTIRGLPNVSFILLDEGDYLPIGQQQEVRDVCERYILKSNPWIVMVSTPNSPLGLFQKIQKEPEETCIYKRIFLDYTYGLNRIYSNEEIEKAKMSPSWEREYCLKFSGLIGNTFHEADIQKAIALGDSYDVNLISPETIKVLGIDSGFSSSAFGVCLLEMIDGTIQVRIAEQYEMIRYEDAVTKIKNILTTMNQWSINQENLEAVKIYCDGSAPEFVRSLKLLVGEDDSPQYWKEQLDQCRKFDLNAADFMQVIPVNFGAGGAIDLLLHTKELLEYSPRSLIGINSKFDKLVTALRTAVSDNQGRLSKEDTSYDDILDATMLALKHFRIKNKNREPNPIMLTK